VSNAQITVEQFRTLALERFDFLEAKGFRRMLSLEETTSTSGTVIYMGKHVGFIFSLDVRDQCVDAQVVKVRDGQLKPSWEGGYSSDIFTHLVKHMGYRGRLAGSVAIGSSDVGIPHLERMIDGWLSLLKEAGQTLVSDQADSLPG
jgi:hypothetical protein